MKPKNRIRIAAASTAVFLGGLSAVGIGMHAQHQSPNTALAPAAQAQTAVVAAHASSAGDETVAYPGGSEHELDGED